MNWKQIQYAIQLSETRSFSKLAKKLSISQPALSKQIKCLEEDIGIKIFTRTFSDLQITPAGEYFIEQAKKLKSQEEQLLKSLEQYKSGDMGRLVVGISPFRNMSIMPSIVKKIKKKYPNVRVVICEKKSEILKKETLKGEYDFSIINLPIDDIMLEVIPLPLDDVVLAVPNNLLHLIEQSHRESNDSGFDRFRNLPFITLGKNQELRTMFEKLCSSCGAIPNIAMEVYGGVITARSFLLEGIGATLLPAQLISDERYSDLVTVFKLCEKITLRQPVIAMRKDQHVSEYAKYAIELLTENGV